MNALRRGAQRIRRRVQAHTRLPGIATALRDHVDHATGGAPVFRTVTAGVDLLLIDGVVRQAGEAEAGQRIGHCVTVDVVLVLRRRRTTEGGDVAITRITLDRTRSQQRRSGNVTRQRQLRQLLGREYGARVDRRYVDGRQRRPHHGNAFQCLRAAFAGGCVERHIGTRTHANLHVLATAHHLTITFQGDGIGAHRQRRRAVTAIGFHRYVAALPGIHVLQMDRCSGNVSGIAENDTRSIRLSHGDSAKAQTQSCRQRRVAPQPGTTIPNNTHKFLLPGEMKHWMRDLASHCSKRRKRSRPLIFSMRSNRKFKRPSNIRHLFAHA